MTATQEKSTKPLICLRDLSNYREATMPDSPDPKGPNNHSLSPVSSVAPLSNMSSRPLSTSSSMSGLNGMHSPHSSINGRTPSPPFLGATGSSQQLPPACGARQLSKLKRFLTTLMQFGSDISPEIGERVRSLVLGLVNSHLSIEEFHSKLQEATNFPLRPFVIPFLKANLPLLQRELLHCAQLAKQTPQQYLAHNEHILFDPARSPVEPQDLAPELNENGKRRSPDRPKENGIDPVHPAKRPHTLSPGGSTGSRVSPGSAPFPFQHTGQIRLEDISMTRELRERERIERERIERERLERERDRHFPGYTGYQRTETFDNLDRIEDDWKHIENMLHSIVTMVDRCKRALAVLQDRSIHDHEELAAWMRRHSDTLDTDMKKRTSDLMATTLRHTEDRVSEVKRRAEEAVNEVKRQAVAELQKAVAAAEAKATEMVSSERAKMDRMLQDTRKQVQEEVIATINHQEESSETCWNCGRKASETCSGCNIARYCGSFCQHKDWENHHRVCGQAQHASGATTGTSSSSGSGGGSSSGNKTDLPLPTLSDRDSATNAQGSVTAEASVTVSVTSSPVAPPPAPPAAPPAPAPSAPSPVNSVTSSKSGSRSCSPTEAKVVEPTH